MINKKIISLSILVGIFGFIGIISAATGPVQINNPLCRAGSGICVNDFKTLLLRIAWYVGMLIGSLGGIMIVWAGILYLTSAGSTERITKARTALFYAIIGIVIGISATAITSIILEIIGAKST